MTLRLPPNHTEVLYWRITDDRRRLVYMNLLSIPLTIVVGLLLTWLAVPVGGLLLVPRLAPTPLELVGLIMGIVITLGLHELAHGLTMRAFGARPQYGMLLGAFAFYATAPGYAFTRNQYLLITLMPLVSLSALALALMALCFGQLIVMLFLICAILNASGASGDVWMTAIVSRYPATAYIIDERDGMRIFLPQQKT